MTKKFLTLDIDSYKSDLDKGLKFIANIPQGVSIFGSARVDNENAYYKASEKLAGILAQNSITVTTGGSDGIMEAANKGAFENGGISVGFNINLPTEQKSNQFLTHLHTFDYLFARKLCLLNASWGYVIFPGGMGTLDELTEVFMHKIVSDKQIMPIVLYNQEYWHPLINLIDQKFISEGMLSIEEKEYFQIFDDVEEIADYLIGEQNGQ